MDAARLDARDDEAAAGLRRPPAAKLCGCLSDRRDGCGATTAVEGALAVGALPALALACM
jgi:hypothetical protein